MNKTIIRVVVAGLGLSCCLNLGAQTLSSKQEDSTKIIKLEEVQVIAGRATNKTPMSFSEIKTKELNKTAYGQDLPYLLSLLPGVVMTSDAGTGIGYTSLKVRGSDASRINITTNGVPLNDAESQGVFWVNMPDFSSSLQDVQLQRGVGTSSNGAGAFGATLNMRTQGIKTSPYATVDLSGGAYGTFRRGIKLGTGRIANHWAFDARLSKINSDGYIDRASVNLKSYFAQAAYFNNGTLLRLVTFGGEEHTGIAWNGINPDKIDKLGRRFNDAGMMEKGNFKDFYKNTDNYDQRHYQAILTQELSDNWTLNATLHYTRGKGYTDEFRLGRKLEEYGLQVFKDSEGNKVKKSDLLRQKHLDNHFYGLVSSVTYKGENFDFTFGAAGNMYDGKHFGYVRWIRNYPEAVLPNKKYYNNTSDKDEASAFVKANWQPIDGLNLFADLQYRGISYKIDGVSDNRDEKTKTMALLDIDKTFNFFNPKAGAAYQIDQYNTVYGSISIGHREPNRKAFTDAGTKGLPTSEKMIDYELGYRFDSRYFQGGVNLYYMDYKDQLVMDGRYSDVGQMLFSNVPNSYRTGVELQLAWTPCRYFRYDLAGAFSRNKIKDYSQAFAQYGPGDKFEVIMEKMKDTDISYSPNVVMSQRLTGMYKGFEIALQTQYVSRQYLDNTQRKNRSMEGYCVSNLMASYHFNLPYTKGCAVSLLVNNLFDTRYNNNAYIYDGGYTVDEEGHKTEFTELRVFPQAPIHLMGAFTINF